MLNEVIEHKRREGDDIAVAVLEFARARLAECDE
jgi:hypothetical protein